MMNKFYEFKKVNEEETELYIYGDITSLKWYEDDVTSYDFAKDWQDFILLNMFSDTYSIYTVKERIIYSK